MLTIGGCEPLAYERYLVLSDYEHNTTDVEVS